MRGVKISTFILSDTIAGGAGSSLDRDFWFSGFSVLVLSEASRRGFSLGIPVSSLPPSVSGFRKQNVPKNQCDLSSVKLIAELSRRTTWQMTYRTW